MTRDPRDLDVLKTWTDELNAVLHPLGILLTGEGAADMLPARALGSPLEVLRSITPAEIGDMAEDANRCCETDRIEAAHIRAAVEGTKRHWQDR